jgi:transcriptional regulator with XRE-family HTH domain
MFYDKFLNLCAKNGVSKQSACAGAGLSSAAWVRWKDGSRPSAVSLQRICDYFGVTFDSMMDDQSEPVFVDKNLKARQELLENTEMKVLFDAAKGIPAHKLYETAAMLMRWKEENHIGSD